MTVDMAKSSKSNRMKMKGYPTHRFLRYKLTHTGTTQDNHYIDLARDLSAMNKRKYDQGRLYGVSSFTLHDNQSRVKVKIAGLRHVWPTYTAYRMARRLWKKQVSSSAFKGDWQQFIVALNRDVITDPDCPLPLDTDDFSCKRGEWMISQLSYSLPAGNEVNSAFVMTGGSNADTAVQQPSATTNNVIGAQNVQTGPMYVRNNYTGTSVSMSAPDFSGTISIMDEWEQVRGDVDSSPASDGNFSNSLFSQLQVSGENTGNAEGYTDELLDRQEREGDHPPYAQDLAGLDDSGTNDALWIYREARFADSQKTIMMPGADIPLGLLQVVTDSGTSGDVAYLDVEIAPGGYKGVHALEV